MQLNIFGRKGAVVSVLSIYLTVCIYLVIWKLLAVASNVRDSNRPELRCNFPLVELLHQDFDRQLLTNNSKYPTEKDWPCILPPTDYANEYTESLNVALCALLTQIGETNFQALGRTCD